MDEPWLTKLRAGDLEPAWDLFLDRHQRLILVAANGTIGVSSYAFRFNDPQPGLATDRWLIQCHPVSNRLARDPACWTGEARLTNSSFNIEAVVPNFAGRLFRGLLRAGQREERLRGYAYSTRREQRHHVSFFRDGSK